MGKMVLSTIHINKSRDTDNKNADIESSLDDESPKNQDKK